MNLDDDVCLCFHVSLRKIIRFVRIEKPQRPSQISQCFGAGTGCGWCRPTLKKLLVEVNENENLPDGMIPKYVQEISPEQYQARRAKFRKEKGSANRTDEDS